MRLALFIAYLLLVGRMKDIRRVFQYHGAEHKTIAAYENDVELTPETAQQFSTAHVRCGTNFLLIVMVVAVFVYSVIPRPNIWFVIGSRIVLVPVIAGELRGDSPRGREHEARLGPCAHAARSPASTTHDASPSSTSSRSRSASLRGLHRRAAHRGRRPGRTTRPGSRARGLTPPNQMAELPLTWTESELLAGDDVAEPLIAGGVRCHGGFGPDGEYVSPRAEKPRPHDRAWQQSHRQHSGTEILRAPIGLWREVFPAWRRQYLLREGVSAPPISSDPYPQHVEGFGSMIRAGAGWIGCNTHFDESITGTTIDHLLRPVRGHATKPGGRAKAATSRCGLPRATSRSKIPSPKT